MFVCIPTAHAAPTTNLVRTVKGAEAATFTVKRSTDLTFSVQADQRSPLFGLMLTQAGGDGYYVHAVAAGYERPLQTSYDLPFPPNNPFAVRLAAGRYALILFSRTTATIRARVTGASLTLRFANQPLQAFAAASTDTSATWEHDFPVALKALPHGAVVYLQDEWTGSRRSSQTTCVWHTSSSRCSALSADAVDQLLTSDDAVPPDTEHRASYGEGFGRETFVTGSNTITVHSLVVGQARRRAALVLIVP